jgi:predicted porin
MKKSLLAVAAMTAFAGAAQAQSSVTVYGIMDVGPKTATTTINNLSNNADATSGGNLSSSRIGFTGSEDLGGGNKAIFTAEFGVNLAKSNFSGSTNGAQNASFDNRQSFVGISSNSLGTLKMGRQYSLSHVTISNTDTTGGNNMIGGTTYVGGNSNTAGAITAPVSANASYGIRSSEAIIYESPVFAGVQAMGQYSWNKASAASGTYNPTADAGLGLRYSGVKNLDVRASKVVRQVSNAASAGLVTSATTTDYGLMATVAASTAFQATQSEQAIGASYDFGMAKLFANNMRTTLAGNYNGAVFTTITRTATEFGVKAPINAFVLSVKYGVGNSNLAANVAAANINAGTGSSFNFRGYQTQLEYNLSKRTSLYSIYGRSSGDTSATTTFTMNAVAAGVRHTF